MLALIFINLFIGTFLVWSGYLIYNKKKYFLIAGYNDMNREQKKRVNIERQSKALKITLYFIGISIAIIPATLYFIGYNNWGRAYPAIILPASLYYIVISVLSIKWRTREG